jgi:hypothetical protein
MTYWHGRAKWWRRFAAANAGIGVLHGLAVMLGALWAYGILGIIWIAMAIRWYRHALWCDSVEAELAVRLVQEELL